MPGFDVQIKDWRAWSPGLETTTDWLSWAKNPLPFAVTDTKPALPDVNPLFKRRFSQLTRMAMAVGNPLTAIHGGLRTIFASQYGEIGQQLEITKGIIERQEVSPAAFSLSVFNTPVSALAIHNHNQQRATALFAGPEYFEMALIEAIGLLSDDAATSVLVIVADERLPEIYRQLDPGANLPYALGLVLAKPAATRSTDGPTVNLEFTEPIGQVLPWTLPAALFFLAWFLGTSKTEVAINQPNYSLICRRQP
jgi:hypothetical protein